MVRPPIARISRLSPELCNQIAAGEVVERPASIVKELVENSLDAWATSVDVTLEGGGQTLIRVQDDGCGMYPDDLVLAVTRHATSKIRDVRDLEDINSYGFRGEALGSIASVSRFSLSSKAGSAPDLAMTLAVNFGQAEPLAPSSLHQGTVVEVRDLFANVPARLKFLKKPASEVRYCSELLQRLALARLDVAFSLVSEERELVRFLRGETLRDRLGHMWPTLVTENLIPVESERGGIRVHGLTALPKVSQPRSGRILIYVNGRAITDFRVVAAIREAYKGRLTSRDYPQAVLFLEVPPADVDVNVHPAKSEVRFRAESEIFTAVLTAVRCALAAVPGISAGGADTGAMPASGGGALPDGSPRGQAVPGPGSYDHELGRQVAARAFRGGADSPGFRRGSAEPLARARRADEGDWELVAPDGRPAAERQVSVPEGWAADAAPTGRTAGAGSGPGPLPEGLGLAGGSAPLPEQTPAGIAARGADGSGAPAMENTAQRRMAPGRLPVDIPSPAHESVLRDAPAAGGGSAAAVPEGAGAGDVTRIPDGVKAGTGAVYPQVDGVEYMGCVMDTYLVLRDRDGALMLVDQHAAHERVLYDRLVAPDYQPDSQYLLSPLRLQLRPVEGERWMEVEATCARLGFKALLDGRVLVVKAVPRTLGMKGAGDFLREVLSEHKDDMNAVFATMACKQAIKAGYPLRTGQVLLLLQQWLATPGREYCPHGRPAVLRWDEAHLEKLFKRRQS